MQWIAAVLNPRDVAPHPNFSSSGSVTPPSLLALLIRGRFFEYDNTLRKLRDDKLELSGSAHELLIVDGAHDALRTGTVAEGATRLARIVLKDQSEDLACSAAVALVATVAFVEVDDYDSALKVLHAALSLANDASRTADALLIEAALLLQVGLRRREIGQSSKEQVQHALEILSGLNPADVTPFPTSPGVSWDSTRTSNLIIELLMDSAVCHLAGISEDDNAWIDIVKSEASTLYLKSTRDDADGYSAQLNSDFDRLFETEGRTYYTTDPIDQPLYSSLLFAELSAHSSCRTRRSNLAMARTLRASSLDRPEMMRDVLRLLRHAYDRKRLNKILRLIRSAGPLQALAGDARQIAARCLKPERLRLVELAVLGAASTLLSREQASEALEGVLGAIEAGLPARGPDWEAWGVRLEEGWKTAIALAETAERLEEVSAKLLDAVRRGPGDALIDRGYARAVESFDWKQLSPSSYLAWKKWMKSAASSEYPNLRDSVRLLLPASYSENSSVEGPLTLNILADLINDRLIHDRPIPEEAVPAAVPIIRNELEGIRRNATQGKFEFGAISAAEVAVGIAMYAGATSLWPDITDFLTDKLVQRVDTARAFDRMAQDIELIPQQVVRTLVERSLPILDVPPNRFEDHVTPYPAALKFIAVSGVLPADRLLPDVLRLVGDARTAARLGAARILSAVARRKHLYEWLPTLAVQLSFDSERSVRGESGRCLALIRSLASTHESLIEERLHRLLEEDGILVPLVVLRGLGEVSESLGGPLRARLEGMGISHPSRTIRASAIAALK